MYGDYGIHGLDIERVLDAMTINRLGVEAVDGQFSDEEGDDGLAGYTGPGGVVRTNEYVRGMADMERQDD